MLRYHPAVGGSDQGKEGLVSGNGDGLALAERPPTGAKLKPTAELHRHKENSCVKPPWFLRELRRTRKRPLTFITASLRWQLILRNTLQT